MNFNEYQKNALRTAHERTPIKLIENGVMGLCGESGECIDIYKKYKHQCHELNEVKLIEEAGDVLWYLANLCEGLGVSLEQVAIQNIRKLERRYPDGFDSSRSINRGKE